MKAIAILTAVYISMVTLINPLDDKEKYKQEIINTDLSMSELAASEGFNTALAKYASDEFIKFGEEYRPTIGKKEFEEKYKSNPGPKTLTWKPAGCDVSVSGDLGYTWGNWKFVLPDTVLYGNYFTAWKRQSDGSWKMALDGGNQTLSPGN